MSNTGNEKMTLSDTILYEEQDEEKIDKIIAFLQFSNITSSEKKYNENSNNYEIYVSDTDYASAKKHLLVFLNAELDNTKDYEGENQDLLCSKASNVYVKSSYKYEEVKSSAVVLLGVGIIGILAIILELAGLYNIPVNPKWLFYSAMGTVFIIFIIIGIYSVISARRLKVAAKEEDSLHDDIIEWAKHSLLAEQVDSHLDSSISEELLYFDRITVINHLVRLKFNNLDEAFRDEICEEIYDMLFTNSSSVD